MAVSDPIIQVTGLTQLSKALSQVDSKVLKAADEVVKTEAKHVAEKARIEATSSPRFPRNLNKTKGGASGPIDYKVKKKGPLSYVVTDAGGLGGKAAAIAEYAETGVSPQGKHLLSVLQDRFPQPLNPGRVAWAILRDDRVQMSAALQSAVDMCMNEVKRLGA